MRSLIEGCEERTREFRGRIIWEKKMGMGASRMAALRKDTLRRSKERQAINQLKYSEKHIMGRRACFDMI